MLDGRLADNLHKMPDGTGYHQQVRLLDGLHQLV